MSNKQLVYEGFTLPRLKVKEILASNAREDIELKNLQQKLDKEKDEVETDFSKTRSQLLSRALDHHMRWEKICRMAKNCCFSKKTLILRPGVHGP